MDKKAPDNITNHSYSLYQSVTRSQPFNQVCTSSTENFAWRFCQAFGDDNSSDDDLITAVEFDPTGNYVTVGDKAGRLCLFEAQTGTQTYRSAVSDHLQQENDNLAYPYPRRQQVNNPLYASAHTPQYQAWVDQILDSEFSIPEFDDEAFNPHASPYAQFSQQRCTTGLATRTIGKAPPPHSTDDITGDLLPKQQHSTLPHHLQYRFYTEFQSHDPEFDCLKSSDIPSTIHAVKWVESTPTSQSLLAANDKTIKLWTLRDKHITTDLPNSAVKGPGSYILPQRVPYQTITLALRRGLYQNAHLYHINSLCPSTNGQNFLSSDDVRILMWDYEYPMMPYGLVDIRPPQLEEITEVITSATMHPSSSDLFIYSTSRGCIRLCDLRVSAECNQNVHTRSFDVFDDPVTKSFFSEIINCISSAKFTQSGQYIISRDYLNVYIWDTRNDSKPVSTFNVHDHLRNHFSDLYELDALFDSFNLDASPDGLQVLTGTYHNNFSVHNWLTGSTLSFEAGQRQARKKTRALRRRTLGPTLPSSPLTSTKDQPVDDDDTATGAATTAAAAATGALSKDNTAVSKDMNNKAPGRGFNQQLNLAQQPPAENVNISLINFNRKALHVAWHPSLDCIAVAGVNKLYIYQAFPQTTQDELL